MIIVRLAGGLGNQLFQYAFGRALAYRHNVALKVDTHWLRKSARLSTETPRTYALDMFALPVEFATQAEIARYVPVLTKSSDSIFLSYAKRGIQRLSRALNSHYIVEKETDTFDATIWETCHADCYVAGYWQSEQYFATIQQALRSELRFVLPLCGRAASLADYIASVESVCVHIRRTDFLTTPNQTTLTADYVKQAVDELLRRHIQPHLFVFSDDIEWCRQHISFRNVPLHYVSADEIGDDVATHFQLMTHCRHFILSISTFGWWAAWLATYPQKIVLHPPHRSSKIWSAQGWITL